MHLAAYNAAFSVADDTDNSAAASDAQTLRYRNCVQQAVSRASDGPQSRNDPLRCVGSNVFGVASQFVSSSSSPSKSKSTSSSDAKALGRLIDDAIADKPSSSNSSSRRGSEAKSSGSVVCEQCGQPYSSTANLNRHRRVTHEGERVTCDFPGCSQTFSQAADLSRHRRRFHS